MGKNILVVDDSVFARSILRKSLELYDSDNFNIFEAYNGNEALTLLKIHKIDVVITDLNMPDFNGEKLLKTVKNDAQLKDIPVVVVTSLLNPAREKRLLEEDALAILQKPVTLPKIREVLTHKLQMNGGI